MAVEKQKIAPEHTAVRVALWRALHLRVDPAPHVLRDEIGEKLVGEANWEARPDMQPEFSKPMRASIVARARFVEDELEAAVGRGVEQYVILGAGLDSLAQRRPELAARLRIFEIDLPGPQEWKKRRLAEIGFSPPPGLRFVPVDFDAGESWWDKLLAAGFDAAKPAFVVSTGVSLYLTKETNEQTFRHLTSLPEGSSFAMTFLLALDLLEGKERGVMEFVMKKAAESGTPFLSLFTPEEILAMAKGAGFRRARYISGHDLNKRYFSGRPDGLNGGNAEGFVVAD